MQGGAESRLRQSFLQPVLDTCPIFVQKMSKFLFKWGLVLASRCTNFYTFPILGYTVMPQEHFFFLSYAQVQESFQSSYSCIIDCTNQVRQYISELNLIEIL
jgi:hypothetical protein